MINWHTTKEEFALIVKIAHRAHEVAEKQGNHLEIRDMLMDVQAVHCNGCPLDLEGLYNASPFDFTHDISGILQHLDRSTGKLDGRFTPRYAKRGE